MAAYHVGKEDIATFKMSDGLFIQHAKVLELHNTGFWVKAFLAQEQRIVFLNREHIVWFFNEADDAV